MSHFYASIQGNKGRATRCGSKSSGMLAHIRGWDIGVYVELKVNERGQDEIELYLTGGSNKEDARDFIGVYTKKDSRIAQVPEPTKIMDMEVINNEPLAV